jgi:hypothetical protein
MKGIEVFSDKGRSSNKGPTPPQRGYNHNSAKINGVI